MFPQPSLRSSAYRLQSGIEREGQGAVGRFGTRREPRLLRREAGAQLKKGGRRMRPPRSGHTKTCWTPAPPRPGPAGPWITITSGSRLTSR